MKIEYPKLPIVNDQCKCALRTLIAAMRERYRAEAGHVYLHGYLGHSIRLEAKGADRVVVKEIISRGYSLEQMYTFLSSQSGRFMGDGIPRDCPAAIHRFVRKFLSSQYVSAKLLEVRAQDSPWNGVEVILK